MTPVRHFDVAERRRRMLSRHRLADPGGSVEQVADALVGLHSTDPATVYLSLYNRLAGFGVADLDDALYERRTLTRILGMRRTLFVAPRELAAVIDAACTRALIVRERRRTIQLLEAEGIENAADVLESACRATLAALRGADGPLPARNLTPLVQELRTRVTMAPGKKYEAAPAITNRVCLHLSTEGHIVRTRPLGSWLSSQYRWTPTERWFDPIAEVPVDVARRELVTRWLRAFGPGTTTDIVWWTKWTKGDVTRLLGEVDAVAVTVEPSPGADPAPAWVLPDDLDDTPPPEPIVRLLPGLDPTIMGWKERAWYFGPSMPDLFDSNGNAGPLVFVDGLAVGAWAQRSDGQVVTEVLEPVSTGTQTGISVAAELLTGWFDGVRVTPRFPNPLERRLANS
jgi:hypothetical protein